MPDANAVANDPKTDVVILHQFPRGYYVPNVSPFPLKVELYLRINKIPYESDFTKPLGPKGKSPWITYNGQDIADSQLIIEFLNEKLNIDMNAHLDSEQRAVAKAFRHLMEDHIYWTSLHDRWVRSGGDLVKKLGPWTPGIKGKLMMTVLRKRMKDQAYGQGMGRHTDEEIKKMQWNAMKALLTFLGSKSYLMGNKISEEDCSIWGFLVQAVYNDLGTEERSKKLQEEFPCLKEYCERIKTEYWTDWNECLTEKPQEKQKGEAKQKGEDKKAAGVKQGKDDKESGEEKENCEEKPVSEKPEKADETPVPEKTDNSEDKPKTETEEIPIIDEVKS